eukprot:scaffold621704_cov15-Prasinocladus_malaysianus.AAC.1
MITATISQPHDSLCDLVRRFQPVIVRFGPNVSLGSFACASACILTWHHWVVAVAREVIATFCSVGVVGETA